MARALGIPLELMPERIVPSEAVIGEVTAEGSRLTGLDPGTPVLGGGVDAPMATFAAGALDRGDNVAMMGTSTCWGIIHTGENFAKELVSMPHVIDAAHRTYTWGIGDLRGARQLVPGRRARGRIRSAISIGRRRTYRRGARG